MSEQAKRSRKAKLSAIAAAIAGSIVSLGLIVAVAAILLFAWIADEVFEGDSVAIDNALREFIHGYATDLLTALMQTMSFWGSTLFLTAATLTLIVLFLARRQHRSAIIMTVVMSGAAVLNYVLKVSFQRPRPLPYFDTPLPASFSFPSGHSLFSACFFGIIAWLIASQMRHSSAKAGVWGVAVVFILLVGLSRVYLGVHYPTDVAAGFLAALVWVSAVITADSAAKGYSPN